MAQQAPLEPGSALYEFAQTVDVSKLPDKLRCKSCDKFLLNAFKTACCEDGICEHCTTTAAGSACPICKHSPLVTNTGKALRATARNYLKNQMADANKAAEPTPNPAPESKETSIATQDESKAPTTNGRAVGDSQEQELSTLAQESHETEQPDDIVQSIETQRESSRRPTIVSASGNDPDDDDIEINVGLDDYEFTKATDGTTHTPIDEVDQWSEEQVYEKPRKNSTLQHTQSQNQNQNQNQSFHGNASFNDFDNSGMNQNMSNMPNEQQFWDMMQSGGMNNMNMFAMMQNQPMMQQMMQQMQQQMQANGMMQNFPGMQYMQSMGMMPQMGVNGQNQNWPGNMMNMMNSNFGSMMNNGASFNNSQQQYQQNYQNGDYRFNRNGSFDRGRGRGRGRNKFRGGFNNQFSHQDQFGNFNNMPFQNQYNQGPMQNQQNQYESNSQGRYQAANNSKENTEQPADDDEFAPGGQDEVQEALGDSYNNKQQSIPPGETKVEEHSPEETKQEEYQREPSPATVEQTPVYESPKPEPKETYIPEAYREDLDFPSAPPTAPLGPASKDVPYRARGHGRFPSRGRGSYQGAVGFPPRSPARPVSQHQTNSPPTNQGSGVVGAPTGPRAMREKDAPPPKSLSRSESDVGFKIRGTATQAREQRAREEQPRNATPQSTHNDFDDREKEPSHRHSKYDRKYDSSRHHESADDYDERDRRRRKSRRDDEYDHDMQDAEYSRSDSQDRNLSHRSGRKDKDRTRDKYSSGMSKQKSSSRKYDDEYEDDRDDANDYGDEVSSRSKAKKSGSKYEDRNERRDRDYERAEKDKHRKRSRHDRDRDDEDHDADEEESRRRSRRHKKEHRKERDHDTESTDLGMRITGRSSTNKASELTTPHSNTPALSDKDPHTLEREARDRERMQKEQQRRQNAMANQKGLSGGRTRSYKFEDEIERSLNKPSRRR